MRTLNPVYPANFAREYRALVLKALREWWNQSIKLIRAALRTYRDSFVDDLFDRVRQLWDEQIVELGPRIRDMFRRLSRAHFNHWLQTLSAATGVPQDTFLALIREPWLADEENSRTRANVALMGSIGAALALTLENTLRNGLRSGVGNQAISAALRAAESAAEVRITANAINEIEIQWATLTQRRHQAAGTPGYIWLLTVSKSPRKEHLARVGYYFTWDNPPPDGHPGQAINCKCGARPAFGPDAYGFPVRERYQHENPGSRRAQDR